MKTLWYSGDLQCAQVKINFSTFSSTKGNPNFLHALRIASENLFYKDP